MDRVNIRQALQTGLGLAIGIGLVSLVTGEWPSPGFLLGIGLVVVLPMALASIDGPLEERTARIGATVVLVLLLGAALWL
ncbi:hypothetical protein [Natronorubrum halophilum]|uniref:hypothetical protein n=1 Tax=Natronorubrum halophilum TaxID=1702106 RepID=UPI0010C1A34A|nr:hypothetical protein [Natronorubrum halophilum]